MKGRTESRKVRRDNLKRIGLPIVISLFIATITSGCWNRRELDSFAIVMGVGVDLSQDGNEYNAAVQILKTSAPKESTTQDSQGDNAYMIVQNRGETLFETLRGFTHIISRQLYMAHNRVIVIGREMAEQGVRGILDLAVRDQEARLTVLLVVADGKAEDVMRVKPKIETTTATEILNLLKKGDANAEVVRVRIFDFLCGQIIENESSIAPIIRIRNTNEGKELYASGTAVFKEDKLVGELSEQQTKGYLFVAGKVKSGTVIVQLPEGKVIYELMGASRKVASVFLEDGRAAVRLKINVKARMGEQTGTENFATPEKLELLQQKLGDSIKDDVMNTIKKAQGMGTDFFCYGELFHREHPEKWEEMKNNWEALFKKLIVEVEVDAKVVGYGGLIKPIYPEKEK